MPLLVNVKLDLKLPGLGGTQGSWEPDEFSSAEGSTRETLNSIYSLFDTTRAVLGGRVDFKIKVPA